MLDYLYVNLMLLPMFVLAIAGGIIWIIALIECLLHEKEPSRPVWLLVIFFLNVIGALVYLFVRRPERIKGKESERAQNPILPRRLAFPLAVFYAGWYALFFFFFFGLSHMLKVYDDSAVSLTPVTDAVFNVRILLAGNFGFVLMFGLPLLWGAFFLLRFLHNQQRQVTLRAVVWIPILILVLSFSFVALPIITME